MSYSDDKIQDLQIQLKALNELLNGKSKQDGLIKKLSGLKDQLETFNENMYIIEHLANSIDKYNELKEQELDRGHAKKIQR